MDLDAIEANAKLGIPLDATVVLKLVAVVRDADEAVLESILAEDGMRIRAEKAETAIRTHRDQRGHDRCRLDDDALYAALPEGENKADTTLPPKDDFIAGCSAYWEARNGGISHEHCSLTEVMQREGREKVLCDQLAEALRSTDQTHLDPTCGCKPCESLYAALAAYDAARKVA